ncbi:F-box/FBD/LRR-repeat protein [Trifolium repens]|nr:F-box/FBD/LRR-repeat protein [Trifolium repens]
MAASFNLLRAEEEDDDEEEEGNDGIDRISSLPNSILCHILSFLPTKTSVCTMSLVSRRWRNLWKNLEVFDFRDKWRDYSYHGPDDEYIEWFMFFTVFVNTALALRRSNVIRKFRLDCDHIEDDPFWAYSIDTWMSIAIGPHLEEFHLTLFTAGFNDLPLKLFSCSNLVSLRLKGYISLQFQDTSEICLPSLKVLHLLDMDHLDLNSVNMLLSGCPVLENLKLCFCPESFAKLQAPSSLTRLKVKVQNEVGTCLEIDAPGLKYLSLTKVILGDVFGNLHNVEEAYLDVFSTPESKSVEPLYILLRALSGVKRLELSDSTTKCLFVAPVLDFPEFRYLLHLKLWLLSFNATFLFDMLQKCPMLQTLITFSQKGGRSYDSSPSYRCEVKPKSVPKCLTMIIDDGWFHSLNQLDEWLKKICDLPRGSAMCQVKFY